MMKKLGELGNTLSRRPFAGGGDAGKMVKYTACSPNDLHNEEELEEIAVVSNADPNTAVKYGSGPLTANGPRVVSGIMTTCSDRQSATVGHIQSPSGQMLLHQQHVHHQRLVSSSGTRLHVAASASPVYLGKSAETVKGGKSMSKQSLLDMMSTRLNVAGRKRFSRDSVAYVNRAHVSSELDVSRKSREARRRDIKGKLERWETSTAGSERVGCARWTFVFDPSGRLCYYWSMVVSVAFLYNFWVLIYRFAFQEITPSSILAWFCLDYLADLLYVLDIVFHFRTGYLEDGVLQTDSTKLHQHYLNSTMFYIDCLCLLPLDFLYLSIGFNSGLRSFRLVKIYRFWAFLDRTERHTNYPNVFRACSLIHYLLVIFHWNACMCHLISKNDGFGSQTWVYPDGGTHDVTRQYLHSFYWSTLTLTTIGDLPRPRTKGEYIFVIVELVFGLLLFATVLGHVANIVTNVSAARKEFQAKLDGVKTYMRMRRVPQHLQVKVIKWFDYLWMTQKSSDEERAVSCLPDKLKAEIAIHVHLDTLKRVEIFQNTEAGFLCELVLKLRPVLFSPGDYICRKGEVGKEMYIVNRGRLQVVADNGKTVLATLKAGSYFGEISILNMGTAGNRRTASVRSVGYSDLFCLYKQDMWDVLKEYPAARVRLEAIAVKRLEKYKKAPLEKSTYAPQPTAAVAMGRSQSTPGLVESSGRVPLLEMYVPPVRAPTSASDYSSVSVTVSASDRGKLDSPMTAASTTSGVSDDDVNANSKRPGGQMAVPNRAVVTSSTPHSADSSFALRNHQQPLLSLGVVSATDTHELLAEIKRLRERLATLEAENASMSVKLSQQQWEVEHRLAEIEMQICGGSSVASAGSGDDNERNRESII